MESSPQPSSSIVADYCSRGILQYCSPAGYLEPSPPLSTDDGDDSPSGSRVSPLTIGLITVLAAAILLFFCYIFAYCKRRRASRLSRNQEEDDIAVAASLAPPSPNDGLDEQVISSLAVFKYRRGDGLVGSSTECAVCLSEFIEDESLRLMTNCQHAFHPPCIDNWLRSHPNCPMCRASVMAAPPPPPPPIRRPPPTVSRMRVQSGGDVVVVVDGSSRNRVRELDLHPPETATPVDGDVDLCLVV